MQLIVATRGSYVHIFGEIFEIRAGENRFQIAPQKVESIVLAAESAISTDALRLASEHNIDVLVLNKYGIPVGRFWHPHFGSTAAIRKAQLKAASSELGLQLVKEWVSKRLKSQARLLQSIGRARDKEKGKPLFEAAKEITALTRKINSILGKSPDSVRGKLMGLEGTAGRIYFSALSRTLPEKWRFLGRSRSPAKDPFNAFLNYAYGVLYGICEKAAVLAGLDPYIGFLHTDNYNKIALVFDIIEPRRVWAEDVVFHLFSGRRVKETMYDKVPGGYTLNKEGKATLMALYNDYLDKLVTYNHRRLSRRNTVLYDCHRIANVLLGKGDDTFSLQIKEV